MASRELSLFLKRQTFRPAAEIGSEITRRFAMNNVGRMFAAAMQDRSIRLYDARTCEEMQRMQDEFLCTSIAFSPKGDIVATGSVNREIKLWDIRSGSCLTTLQGHAYPILALAFSPDGDKLVSGSGDTTLKIWDLDNNSQLFDLKGHGLYVVSCDWDPNDNRIVSSSVDASICEWDPFSGNLLTQHNAHRTAVQTVRFTKDGSMLGSGSSDTQIILWDAEGTLKPIRKLSGHKEEVRAVAFSFDSKYLASGSSDKEIFVWDVENGSIEGESSTLGEIDGIEWYPDELSFISSDGTGAIARWEVKQLDAMMAPFKELLADIENDPELTRKDELIQKYNALQDDHDSDTLRDKRIFYILWQCKRALGLLKGTRKKN